MAVGAGRRGSEEPRMATQSELNGTNEANRGYGKKLQMSLLCGLKREASTNNDVFAVKPNLKVKQVN